MAKQLGSCIPKRLVIKTRQVILHRSENGISSFGHFPSQICMLRCTLLIGSIGEAKYRMPFRFAVAMLLQAHTCLHHTSLLGTRSEFFPKAKPIEGLPLRQLQTKGSTGLDRGQCYALPPKSRMQRRIFELNGAKMWVVL